LRQVKVRDGQMKTEGIVGIELLVGKTQFAIARPEPCDHASVIIIIIIIAAANTKSVMMIT
jgi:hypothetical protein